MDKQTWIFTGITVVYIVLFGVYFWRRSARNERELKAFLLQAKEQMDKHQKRIHSKANQKLTIAFQLIQKLQTIAANLESQAQAEYQKIMDKAQDERASILEEAKKQADKVIKDADKDLDKYRHKRQQEIEADMVNLVIKVTEKVVQQRLIYKDHISLIKTALDDVKQQKDKLS